MTTSSPSGVVSFMWIVIVKTLCERLERLFRLVSAVLRLAVPRSNTCNETGIEAQKSTSSLADAGQL